MKFLITNDDGIEATGLSVLSRVLNTIGATVVVAPDRPQSGIGHQVTDHKPIRLNELGSDRYTIDGTPADCARIGLSLLAPDAGWLLAGINHGGNLGADVYMSGTVAAAREAAMMGYRAIAVSHYTAKDRPVDWTLAERRVVPVLDMLLQHDLPTGYFWNVNLPHPPGTELDLDTVFCALDANPLHIAYRRDHDHLIYTGRYQERPRQPGRDVDICLGGKVTITRIPLDIVPEP